MRNGKWSSFFKWFTGNEYHRERKSVFLPTSINQFQGNEIIEVKRMRKGKMVSLSSNRDGKSSCLKKETPKMSQINNNPFMSKYYGNSKWRK